MALDISPFQEWKPPPIDHKPWKCTSGTHILGEVGRKNGVRRLCLNSGHVITGAAEIYCERCQTHREWHSGAEGLRELLERGRALDGARVVT